MRLPFIVCLISNQPHFAFHLLEVCLGETHKQAGLDAKAHAVVNPNREKVWINTLQRLAVWWRCTDHVITAASDIQHCQIRILLLFHQYMYIKEII